MLVSLEFFEAGIFCSGTAIFDFRDLFESGEVTFTLEYFSWDICDETASFLLDRAYPSPPADLKSLVLFLASFYLSLDRSFFCSFCITLLFSPLKAFDS